MPVAALLVGAAISAAASAPVGLPVFSAPVAARWRLSENIFTREDCREASVDGSIHCKFDPRGIFRRFANWNATDFEKTTFLLIEVDPVFCDKDHAFAVGSSRMQEYAQRFAPDEPVAFEARNTDSILARKSTLVVAFVLTPSDLVRVEVHSTRGITPEDEADFQAVVDSVRSIERLNESYRRGLWLFRHRNGDPERESVAMCGMPPEQRMKLAVQELWRATREQPESWAPWALLGQITEERAGGPDPLIPLLAGVQSGVPSSGVWSDLGSDPLTSALDVDAAREAARLYAEAARREPPIHADRLFDEPLDRSSVLAREARVHLRLGETEQATACHRRAIEGEPLGSWGLLESSLFLAQDAYARGDKDEARRLYELAQRAWWAFFESDFIQWGHGPAMRARIEQRLRELGKAK